MRDGHVSGTLILAYGIPRCADRIHDDQNELVLYRSLTFVILPHSIRRTFLAQWFQDPQRPRFAYR